MNVVAVKVFFLPPPQQLQLSSSQLAILFVLLCVCRNGRNSTPNFVKMRAIQKSYIIRIKRYILS